ncbi:hypothetical protein LguiA_032384 [Lonicera macranthoides]
MKISKCLLVVLFFSLCIQFNFITAHNHKRNYTERKPYIVYMGELPEKTISLKEEHHSLLAQAIGNEKTAREHKIYSYGKSFNAFAAWLLPHEAQTLQQKEGVVSVFRSTIQKLHTTRSWDFLDMTEELTRRNPKMESNLIMGILDTGIYVDSPSFNDSGYGPPPKKWKGTCVKGVNFTGCNNKVIGARYYNLEEAPYDLTPLDTDGHGTHTASTAAGIRVKGASLYGLGRGTARGGVSSARLAVYKVCWGIGCSDMDLLAGFDAAISDGVDIISVSIGGASRSFFTDPMAIGAFHALKKGILTVCAAGNEGPDLFSVQNVAPWLMTIAATSTDRKFETVVKLGNEKNTSGISLNTFSPKKKMYPLTSGALAANLTQNSYGNASACEYGTLSEKKVKGKIVFCLGMGGQDDTIKECGGAGIIITNDGLKDTPFSYLIPTSVIDPKDGVNIDKYINFTKAPKAVIYKSKSVKTTAPFIASFSARGPQLISQNILKPDLAAPGLNILAAYSKFVSITGVTGDNRYENFNIISGTSMACPHAAAAAAYVKTFRPKWSPAAIKSALMTTATPMKIKPITGELATGSGQIHPRRAVKPGLVFNINVSGYIRYLCKEGYNETAIRLLTGSKKSFNCSSLKPALGIDGLNYPTMHIQLQNRTSTFSGVFYRTATYVEGRQKKATYLSKIRAPKGLTVSVTPKVLKFDQGNHKRSFRVAVKGKFLEEKTWLLSGVVTWKDSRHNVKMPLVIYRPFV